MAASRATRKNPSPVPEEQTRGVEHVISGMKEIKRGPARKTDRPVCGRREGCQSIENPVRMEDTVSAEQDFAGARLQPSTSIRPQRTSQQ